MQQTGLWIIENTNSKHF